ncbi:MAG: hypothetical protein KF777_23305 [Planctomycetaceae bacterium]|nr:hypothetical protein [Planctomycetaceae bacterium]
MNHTEPAHDCIAIPIPTKRHYWLRDSFTHLVGLAVEVTPGRLWANGAEQGDSIDYPKTTLGACRELQIRGLNASVPALNYLIRRGLVQPTRTGRNYEWFPKQIDWAAEYFNQRQVWTATTQFCRMADLEFGQVVKAYRVAAARFSLPFSPDFEVRNVVAVIEPASAPAAFAQVWFYSRSTAFRVHDGPAEKQEVTA